MKKALAFPPKKILSVNLFFKLQTVFVVVNVVKQALCFKLTDFGKVVYTSLRRLKVLLFSTYLFSTKNSLYHILMKTAGPSSSKIQSLNWVLRNFKKLLKGFL